jgi:uncharacterized protein YijF (DUF1287 family)
MGTSEQDERRGAGESASAPPRQATLGRRSLLLGLFAMSPTQAAVAAATHRSAEALVAAARRQVGVTLTYDPRYTALAFPGGDVPRARGVCTDVIIRAYRDAFGLDLQALVNADMRRGFAAYPHLWGLKTTDRSIDHRRAPNLAAFFTRQHARLPVPQDPNEWRPGDVFTSLINGRLPHTGIVSDRRPGGQAGYVIHNIGYGAREEPALFAHPLTGRFRWALDD